MTQSNTAPADASVQAIGFMVLAAALVAATSLLAKAAGLSGSAQPGLHPLQISAGRFAFALLALLACLAVRPDLRPSLDGANWRLHLLRSVVGWLGVTCMFGAVAGMPVAEATAISFLSPLIAMGLSVMLLGERLGPRKIIAALLAVLGAGLLLRPGTEALEPAAWLALGAAGFMGVEMMVIKRLSDREPALRVLLINNSIGAMISISVAMTVWLWPSAWQWGLMAVLGTVMVIAQSAFIQAMKRGEASFVAPAFYCVLVFAALYDFLFFGVIPGWLVMLGAALIVSGALTLAVGPRRG